MPYIHSPTGLVERGVRTIKQIIITNIKDSKSFSESLDIALNLMRMTKNSRLNKSVFESYLGRKPQIQLNNFLSVYQNSKKTDEWTYVFI